MSLLPGRILPQSQALGRVNKDQTVTIDKDWWLFFYNLFINTLGVGGLSAADLISIEESDSDASDTDATVLRQPISNQAVQVDIDPYQTAADFPGIAKALLLAQDPVLQDPPAQAQPALAITPGASPYAYTAPFNGQVIVTGGVVSVISITRQGTVIATGLTDGMIMVSRLDIVTVTYASVPTMTFLPT